MLTYMFPEMKIDEILSIKSKVKLILDNLVFLVLNL